MLEVFIRRSCRKASDDGVCATRDGDNTDRVRQAPDERAGHSTARASEVPDESAGDHAACVEVVRLDYEQRQRSRLRVTSSWGREIALKLPRGTFLEDGDQLQVTDGSTVRVVAASERLSRVECSSARELARVAYHLGNRHVALEVGEGYVAYQRDHVLDEMLNRLGLRTDSVYLPFSPEPGAYQGHDWGSPSVTYVGNTPLLRDGSGV